MKDNEDRLEDKIDRLSACVSAMVVRLDGLNSFKQKCETERSDYEKRLDSMSNAFNRMEGRTTAYGKAIMIGLATATIIISLMSFMFNRMEKSNLNTGLNRQIDRLSEIILDNRKMIEENRKKLEMK